jgi:hypothetical protein
VVSLSGSCSTGSMTTTVRIFGGVIFGVRILFSGVHGSCNLQCIRSLNMLSYLCLFELLFTKLYHLMYRTESSVAVAAPVKRGLGKRQALSKVTVKNDTTDHRDCMMDTSINSTKYKQFLGYRSAVQISHAWQSLPLSSSS